MTHKDFLEEWNNNEKFVTVHTSGSTGAPKAMHVEKRRMEASARITCDFLGLKPGDTALLCLPMDYIAGKMMAVRALTRGLRLLAVEPSGHPLKGLAANLKEEITSLSDETNRREGSDVWCDLAAMVPMQVVNSLQNDEERRALCGIRHLIIGGGAIDDNLEKSLKMLPHAVWSTYGMTETLSHIALRRLNGPEASEWYTPFDSMNIRQGKDGCLIIDAPLVAEELVVTHDIVEIAPDGRRFKILGRKDNVICSGGIKIQIEEVERLLKPHLTLPFMVSKKKDSLLGEAVALLTEDDDIAQVRTVCKKILTQYWQPRYYLHVEHLPMTKTGKPARKEAEELLRKEGKARV